MSKFRYLETIAHLTDSELHTFIESVGEFVPDTDWSTYTQWRYTQEDFDADALFTLWARAVAKTGQYSRLISHPVFQQSHCAWAAFDELTHDSLVIFLQQLEQAIESIPETFSPSVLRARVHYSVKAGLYQIALEYFDDFMPLDFACEKVVVYTMLGHIDLAIEWAARAWCSSSRDEIAAISQYEGMQGQIRDTRLLRYLDVENFPLIADGRRQEWRTLSERHFKDGCSDYEKSYMRPRQYLQDLVDLAKARLKAPQQDNRPLYDGQRVIYGDYEVDGNFYVRWPMTILGNLTVSGSILASHILNVSGAIRTGALFAVELVAADTIDAQEFVACYPGMRARKGYERRYSLVCRTLSSRLFLNDGISRAVFADLEVEHHYERSKGRESVELMQRLLKPECFVYLTNEYWDFSPMDLMARQGVSVFKGSEAPWHTYSSNLHLGADEGFAEWSTTAAFLPIDIVDHMASITNLDLSGIDLGRVPPVIQKLANLEVLDISRMNLATLPDFIWTLPKLKNLRFSDNPILLERIKQRPAQTLLAFSAKEKLPAGIRLRLRQLIDLSLNDAERIAGLAEEDYLLAFRIGGAEFLQPVHHAWTSDNAVFRPGDVVSIFGKTKLKLSELTAHLESLDVLVFNNELVPDTTHVLLGNKPTAKAMKNFDLEIAKSLTMISEVQCIAAIEQAKGTKPTPEQGVPKEQLIDDPDYFKQRAVVITGTFKSMKREELVAKLKGVGAKVRNDVNANTDLLIAGVRAGSKLGQAQALGVEQWGEARILAVLDALPQESVSNGNYLVDASISTVQTDPYGYFVKLSDQPVASFLKKGMMPEQLAYACSAPNTESMYSSKNIDQLRGLALYSNKERVSPIVIEHAQKAPNLSNVCIAAAADVPLQAICDAYPNLHTLWCRDDTSVVIEPVRHSTLQQLTLRHKDVDLDGLAMCSFPKLSYLEVGGEAPAAALNTCFDQQQFPHLKHLGLYMLGVETSALETAFNDLKFPKLESLSLAADDSISINTGLMDALIRAPIAKTLKTLHLSDVHLPDRSCLNSENFPLLTRLGLHSVRGRAALILDTIAAMNFVNGIHLDLMGGRFRTDDARALLAILPACNIRSINLDNNHILSKAVQQELAAHSVPISVWNQKS